MTAGRKGSIAFGHGLIDEIFPLHIGLGTSACDSMKILNSLVQMAK